MRSEAPGDERDLLDSNAGTEYESLRSLARFAGALRKRSEFWRAWNVRQAAVIPPAPPNPAALEWSGGATPAGRPNPGWLALDSLCTVFVVGDVLIVRRARRELHFRAAPGAATIREWRDAVAAQTLAPPQLPLVAPSFAGALRKRSEFLRRWNVRQAFVIPPSNLNPGAVEWCGGARPGWIELDALCSASLLEDGTLVVRRGGRELHFLAAEGGVLIGDWHDAIRAVLTPA